MGKGGECVAKKVKSARRTSKSQKGLSWLGSLEWAGAMIGALERAARMQMQGGKERWGQVKGVRMPQSHSHNFKVEGVSDVGTIEEQCTE